MDEGCRMTECGWCAGTYTNWSVHTRTMRHRVWTVIASFFFLA
ncbi:hypothetical protein RitSun_39 [Mycobacterium phage RitSun]|nr:hypothetical protein RitSun_39 [Mycobacterium phage RitSun]